MEKKYIVIKELHASTRVSKNFYIFDFMFVLIYLGCSLIFRSTVVPELQILYFIFNGVVAIKLVSRTRTNPGKHYYQALLLWYKRDTILYSSIKNLSKNRLRETMKHELESQSKNRF
ncbi:DUF5592 family protein [Serratia marcescens]|uniref:DUF5592 family protein n=1 Tax=Serratia marcescens TaxID=615 RepID=UPI0011E66399|nr:DUF5592 family protein [Serratia marcescens]